MITDPRARWNAAVASQRAFAEALDAQDTLAPTDTPEAVKFLADFNRALSELEDAREALRGTPHAITSLEWVSAYRIHREAMFRWNKRRMLDVAKQDVEGAREGIAALYARIMSGRLFDIAPRRDEYEQEE